MKNYRVNVPYVVWCQVDVEAEDKDAAIEEAIDKTRLEHYVGNCVGPDEGSIEATDEALESGNIGIIVEGVGGEE